MRSMLKKLTPRMREAMRRMVTAETPKEISEELGVSYGTVQKWLTDPLFRSALAELEFETEKRFLDSRQDAMQILEDASVDAAQFNVDTMKDEDTDRGLRMKSAWDILDRTNKKAPTKIDKILDLAELIVEAHNQRNKTEPIDVTPKEKQLPESDELIMEVSNA